MRTISNLYVIAATSVIGGGLFGFDISSMSAIITTDQYLCYFNQGPVPCQGPRANVQGGIVASMPGGSWFGALLSGYISDVLGRKKAIMIGCVIWCIGCAVVSSAQNIPSLIAGRILNGFCVGICSAQVPVYIAEISPPSKRGRFIGMQQWAITWGIMIMFFISYGCTFVEGPAAFRIPWALQAIPAILLFVMMFFLPESPRWLARQDRWDECMSILALVHGKNNPDSRFVQLEYQDIKDMVEFERENEDVSYIELLKPSMLNRTHIGLFAQIWSQLTGVNVSLYYVRYIFAIAGLTHNANLLASSVQYIINVVMTVPALLYMDSWGRRPSFLVGAALMMAWLWTIAALMSVYGTAVPSESAPFGRPIEEAWQIVGAPAKGVIACSYLFVASFAVTWGPTSWTYPPELYPLRVRGKAVALAASGNWAFNFALAYFVPTAFVNIQWRTYLVFGTFCVAMFVHVYFMFPETAGRTLEEVESIFTDPSGPKYIGTPAWKTKKATARARAMESSSIETAPKMRSSSYDSPNSLELCHIPSMKSDR